MLTLAVMSQKGGAGKSTLSLHLATEAAARGVKALLIDLDPQGNLLGWADRRGDRAPDVQALHASRLDAELASAAAEGYQMAVIDTAPSADRTAMVAAKAASLILVPCRPAQFDMDAVWATLTTCQMVKRPSLVVLNQAPIRSRVVDESLAALRSQQAVVSATIIRSRVAFQHCLTDGQTAGEFEPGGPAAQEITALYDNVYALLSVGTATSEAA